MSLRAACLLPSFKPAIALVCVLGLSGCAMFLPIRSKLLPGDPPMRKQFSRHSFRFPTKARAWKLKNNTRISRFLPAS